MAKIYNGIVPTASTITEPLLATALLAYPQIKKQVVKAYCDQENFCFLRDLIGLDASINETEFQARVKSGQLGIAGGSISWAVENRTRQPLTVTTAPTLGSSIAVNATTPIAFAEGWARPGMVIKITDSVTGGFYNLILVTGPTGVGPYGYTAKVLSTTATTMTAGIVTIGDKLPWAYIATSTCVESCVLSPVVFPDWYKNWTTKMCLNRVVCTNGLTAAIWIEGENGSMCYQSTEESQVFTNFLTNLEMASYYGSSDMDATTNLGLVTGPDGTVNVGDGIERQISGGNVNTYSLATYVTSATPTMYALFRDYVEGIIQTWASQRNIGEIELFVRAGNAAYSYWQKALFDYSMQFGGCCTLRDFKTGEGYDYKLGGRITGYSFSGYTIWLEKCMVFSNPALQHVRTGQTVPLESYKFLIHPKTTCDGKPLYEIYFREGCGVSSAYTHKIIPGKVNPIDPSSPIASNAADGYTVLFDTEFVVIVNDPGRFLLFQPVA